MGKTQTEKKAPKGKVNEMLVDVEGGRDTNRLKE